MADRVRQVERLEDENSITNKYHKKEKFTYLEEDEYLLDIGYEYVEDREVNVVELKLRPPYVCKLLKPSIEKNPVEPNKNEKFVTKTYTFDITKCDKIFYLQVTNGQIIMPQGLKNPPLEQRKNRGFCKYHNFLDHKTSQCVVFRNLVRKDLKEG